MVRSLLSLFRLFSCFCLGKFFFGVFRSIVLWIFDFRSLAILVLIKWGGAVFGVVVEALGCVFGYFYIGSMVGFLFALLVLPACLLMVHVFVWL